VTICLGSGPTLHSVDSPRPRPSMLIPAAASRRYNKYPCPTSSSLSPSPLSSPPPSPSLSRRPCVGSPSCFPAGTSSPTPPRSGPTAGVAGSACSTASQTAERGQTGGGACVAKPPTATASALSVTAATAVTVGAAQGSPLPLERPHGGWQLKGFGDGQSMSGNRSTPIIQCVLVIRESVTTEYESRVFHSCPCGPLFLHIEPNRLSLITRTHCIGLKM